VPFSKVKVGESWQKGIEQLQFSHENTENAIKLGKNCLRFLKIE